MKKIIGMTTILAFIFNFSFAQQRIITIVDDATGAKIVGAHLRVSKNKDLKGNKTIISDVDGRITINLDGTHFYSLRAIGFNETKGTIPDKQRNVTIRMKELSVVLDQFVVRGSNTLKPIKQSPVMIQVISGQKLIEAGFQGVKEALMQEMPGMNFQKVGFGTDVNISGLDARNILFLIDGERLTGEMAGNLDYQRFNIHSIERIEIVKGSSSILYGSMASGAVINMITKKTKENLSIKVGSRYSQRNELNYSNPLKSDFLYMYEKNVDKPNLQSWLSIGSQIGKFTSQTDVLYNSTDAYYLFHEGHDEKTFRRNPDIGLMSDTIIRSYITRPPLGVEGDEYLNISQKIYFDPMDNLSFQAYSSFFFMNTYDMIKDLIFNQTKDLSGGLKSSYRVKDIVKISLTLHRDDYKRFKRHERKDERKNLYDSKIFQPRLLIESNYFNSHALTFGAEYNMEKLVSDRFGRKGTLTARESKELDCFLQDEYSGIDKTKIAVGLRTSFNELFGINLAPKFSFKYNPMEELALRFNYASGYRIPTIKEKFFDWDHLGMFQIVGNPDLKPEKNNYFSLSAEYQNAGIFLNVNAYTNRFRNKIEGVWRIFEFQYNFEYQNLLTSALLGVDVLGRAKLNNNFMINCSYSYVDVSETNGVQLNTSSPHNGNIQLEYKLERKNYVFKTSLSTSIIGPKKFNVQDKLMMNGKAYDTYFEVDLPSYTMTNLTVNQIFYDKYRLTLGLDNVLNYKPTMLGAGVSMFNIPATPGRRFFAQLEYSF